MRGQVTIEFILILVIMLVILATISLPTVDRMEQDVFDTGNAINLAAIQYRIVNTAEELNLAGCDSHKTIRIHLPFDYAEKRIQWDSNEVGGGYFLLNTTYIELNNISYPSLIAIVEPYAILPDDAPDDGYWNVTFTKDCEDVISSEGTIGGA